MIRIQIPLLNIALGLLAVIFLSACSKDGDNPTQNDQGGGSLPSTIANAQFNLEVTFAASAAPYQMGQQALFSFGSDGSLSIDLDPNTNNGNELRLTNFSLEGLEYVWSDQAAGYKYALSLDADDSINEVNVFDTDDNFLNQWTPIKTGNPELALIQDLAGTYSVSNVLLGSHDRMSVIIAADGSIDFDNSIQFDPADYALITDRLDVLDGIWIDMLPYPSTPYPRLELFVDPADQTQLVKMIYRSNYPNAGGTTEVEF
jgi:hypothetical protein